MFEKKQKKKLLFVIYGETKKLYSLFFWISFLKELHMALSDIVEDILNAHDTTKVRLAMSNLFFSKNNTCSKSRCVI